MRPTLLVGVGVMVLGLAACGGDSAQRDGSEIRDDICYVDVLTCDGPCPTYDEDIAELRATICPMDPRLVAVGTCGAYRFTAINGGYSGGENSYDAGGKLVATYSFIDTPGPSPCGAPAFAVHMGPVMSCVRVETDADNPCNTSTVTQP
jgi:hypothetical protein